MGNNGDFQCLKYIVCCLLQLWWSCLEFKEDCLIVGEGLWGSRSASTPFWYNMTVALCQSCVFGWQFGIRKMSSALLYDWPHKVLI